MKNCTCSPSQYTDYLSGYRDSRCKDKMDIRPSCPYDGIPYTGKTASLYRNHDDVIKWKHFLRYWPFVRGIHRSPVNSPHKGQWRRALMFSLICARINVWVNNGEAGVFRRSRAHYDVIVMDPLVAKTNSLMANDPKEHAWRITVGVTSVLHEFIGIHYNDVIMSSSQITSPTIIYSGG